MDAILMSLMTALNEHLLINVYQRDTDDLHRIRTGVRS